jgi:hypothetical protein
LIPFTVRLNARNCVPSNYFRAVLLLLV